MEMPVPFLLMLLLVIVSIFALILQLIYRMGYKKAAKDWESRIEEIKQQALNQQRAVIKGKVSEQLAPFLPEFPFLPSECRFLGSPIDLVVFQGMDKGLVENVYLIDVKTNSSQLSPLQLSIQQAVQEKKVFWHTYRIKLEEKSQEAVK